MADPTSIKPAAPVRDAIVDASNYMATKVFQDYLLSLDRAIPTLQPLVARDFGALGNGINNDTKGLQKAIDQAVALGGGAILLASGTYLLDTITFPATSSTVPISLQGQGESTILKRRSDLTAGKGMIEVYGSNITFDSFAIDGGVTVPVGLLYNADFLVAGNNDPMAPVLTQNTSIWVRGGVENFLCQRIAIRHTGGYAILIDAITAGINDVRLLNCKFENNRPHLFGVTAGQEWYGSWTGGVYVNGDGRAANPGRVLKEFLVAQCRFQRNTGNCLWSHLYGLDELHEDFLMFANYFLDCGLDGILIGGVTGGAVSGNVFRRIGYTTLTDDDRSVPRWLPGVQATALDTSGLVKGVPYVNNSFLSINGGCMDLDGFGDSSIVGNTARCPYPDELEYETDRIAISGPNNNGSASYGLNLGNTSNTPYGGCNVVIAGNTFINLMAGSIRMYSARNCHATANNVVVPDAPLIQPIVYGPGGTGVNQRATGNVIRHNRVQYSPAIAAPVVYEDSSVGAFTVNDVNYVFGNCPIIGNGNATEFQKNPDSGSPTFLETIWFT